METNELIAEFMQLETTLNHKGIKEYYQIEYNSGGWYEEQELRYHESWDWIRSVVVKIEQDCEGVPQEMLNISLYSDINEVYSAVVEFIKEYNKQN